ncbi:hypothetical protein PspLS_07042 [Pyricularia sp. CBS 133598]|nr:hypothetical protein PspLS_07042 [Pyricularia sp. CBS 133598]
MTSDKHPFLVPINHLPKSLQLAERAPFGCIAEDPLQQCEWVNRLLIPTYKGTFLIDDTAQILGISRIFRCLKHFFRHWNNKPDKQSAGDNRSTRSDLHNTGSKPLGSRYVLEPVIFPRPNVKL